MTQHQSLTSPELLSAEALDRLFHEARSINSFSGPALTEEEMRHVYDLTKMPPTMMNTQPLRVTWVVSEEARQKLAGTMQGGNAAKTLAAPSSAVLSFDTDFHEHIPFLFPHAPERKEFFADAGPRAERARENGWLQAGYFILAVRSIGHHAGPITGVDFAAVDELFNGGTAKRAFMVVNIGQPGQDAYFDRLPRFDFKTANEIV
ncbi:malonic semialdehyde reductase [Micrococcoides hystricis]|uniref:Malonic semialdehyde reductase n=1 Tax=Micrococcoides hystricis TaxID=1572761 RepID=A0ABV6PB27_9MICC